MSANTIWKFSPGKGRGRHSLPHAVMTVSDTFVAEVDSVQTGKLIVELLDALIVAAAALQIHTTEDGPEFRAWKRAEAAIEKARLKWE